MAPYTVRWGIMATGGIAKLFTKDLVLDPELRETHDVQHTVSAVASSSALESAEKFIKDIVSPKQSEPACAAYGSYSALVQDPNVDIIYVATPHSHHFEHVKLCLAAGKNVLCEKPLTVNAQQARQLVDMAKEKRLFFMEATWTRFFPLSIAVRKHITDGAIGEVIRGTADLSHILDEDQWDPKHRLLNPDLAGGCLMDIGPYPILWLLQTMWHTLPKELQTEKPRVVGTSMLKDSRTGVDIMTTLLLEFPRSTPSGASRAQAVATAGFQVRTDPDGDNTAGPAIRLYGTKGELQVFWPTHRPEKFKILLHSGQVTEEKFKVPGDGHGMFWEADEAARCLRDGKLESAGIPWEESILVAELLDEARKQGGLVFPKSVDPIE